MFKFHLLYKKRKCKSMRNSYNNNFSLTTQRNLWNYQSHFRFQVTQGLSWDVVAMESTCRSNMGFVWEWNSPSTHDNEQRHSLRITMSHRWSYICIWIWLYSITFIIRHNFTQIRKTLYDPRCLMSIVFWGCRSNRVDLFLHKKLVSNTCLPQEHIWSFMYEK